MYGTATEDMDALTFGSSVVLRHLTASEQKYVIMANVLTRANQSLVGSCQFVRSIWTIY